MTLRSGSTVSLDSPPRSREELRNDRDSFQIANPPEVARLLITSAFPRTDLVSPTIQKNGCIRSSEVLMGSWTSYRCIRSSRTDSSHIGENGEMTASLMRAERLICRVSPV